MNLNSTAKDNSGPSLAFSPSPASNPSEIIIVGRRSSLSRPNLLFESLPKECYPTVQAMLKGIEDSGKAAAYLPRDAPAKLAVVVLPPPETISRHNHPFSPHRISDALADLGLHSAAREGTVQVHVVDDRIEEFMCPAAAAVARTLPLYDAKSRKRKADDIDAAAATTTAETGVNVSFHDGRNPFGVAVRRRGVVFGGEVRFRRGAGAHSRLQDIGRRRRAEEKGRNVRLSSRWKVSLRKAVEPGRKQALWRTAPAVAEGVRLAARLGDMPPAELDPDAYAAECKIVADSLVAGGADVTFREVKGEALREGGYGGIYGVGMAARCPPRMIVMTYKPDGVDGKVEHVALCGKGVIYDTGGLSLKPKIGMCGMKHDMGGSAGVLGGFQAAVQLKLPRKITLILAIVENAIGPDAVRNDDILTMKSGKTVEINNTDAEGRLILADCVSHASNGLEGGAPDVILDMATLTGAQLITTGKKHAGVLAKTRVMEERIYEAGLRTGDLTFPMLYAPEFLKSEFESKVADMKNSVANRSNAQASCAGHFIESHIDDAYEGDWVHVDMAGPDSKDERATGYGVALILGLLKAPGFC